MNESLTKFTTEELLAELNLRTQEEVSSKDEMRLVVGSIGNDCGTLFCEVFNKIETHEDLSFLSTYKIRMRFNTHRNYRLFYFKTDQFEYLLSQLDSDNEQFAIWVDSLMKEKRIKELGY